MNVWECHNTKNWEQCYSFDVLALGKLQPCVFGATSKSILFRFMMHACQVIRNLFHKWHVHDLLAHVEAIAKLKAQLIVLHNYGADAWTMSCVKAQLSTELYTMYHPSSDSSGDDE